MLAFKFSEYPKEPKNALSDPTEFCRVPAGTLKTSLLTRNLSSPLSEWRSPLRVDLSHGLQSAWMW